MIFELIDIALELLKTDNLFLKVQQNHSTEIKFMRAKNTLLFIPALYFASASGYALDPYPEGVISYTPGEKSFTMTLKDQSVPSQEVRAGIRINGLLVTNPAIHTTNHRLSYTLPPSYQNGEKHEVVVWAVNIRNNGSSPGTHSSYYSTFSVNMNHTPPPAELNIQWGKSAIGYGDDVSLSWSTDNVQSCNVTVNGSNISSNASGSKSYTRLKSNQTAKLACIDKNGKAVQTSTSMTVRPDALPVIEGPTGTLTSSSFTAKAYDTDTTKKVQLNLWWDDPIPNNPNKIIQSIYTDKNTAATFTIPEEYREKTHKFQLAASSFYENGTRDTSRYTVRKFDVNIPAPVEPNASLSIEDASVPYDNNTTINWQSDNASSCKLNGIDTPLQGQQALNNLTASSVYTLVCEGHGKTVTRTATVNVEPTVTFDAPVYTSNQLTGKLNVDGAAESQELRLTVNNNATVHLNGNKFTVDLPKALRTGLEKDITLTLSDHNINGILLRNPQYTKSFTKEAWFKAELEQSDGPQDITIDLAANEQYCLHSQVSVVDKNSVTINGNNAEITQCGLIVENELEPDLFENYIKTSSLGLFYFDNIATVNVNQLSGKFTPKSSQSLKRFIDNCENTSACQNASDDELAAALWWAHWYKLTFTERVIFDHSFIYTKSVGSVNLNNLDIQDFVKGIIVSNNNSDYSYDINNIKFDGILDNLHRLAPFKLDLYGSADGAKNTVSPSVVFSKVDGLDENAYSSAFNNIVSFTQPAAAMVAGYKYHDVLRNRTARFDEKLCAPWGKDYRNFAIDDNGEPKTIDRLFYKDCINSDNANVAIVTGLPGQTGGFCHEDVDGAPLSCSRTINNVKVWNNGPAVVQQGVHDHSFISDIQCNVNENPFANTTDLGSHGDNCVYVSYGKKVTISDVETTSIRGAIVKVRGALSHIENVKGDNALFPISLQAVNNANLGIEDDGDDAEKFFTRKGLDTHMGVANTFSSYINNVEMTNSKQAFVHVQDYELSGEYKQYIRIGDNVSITYGGTGWGSSAKAVAVCEGAHNPSAFANGNRPYIVATKAIFDGLADASKNISVIRKIDANRVDANRECFVEETTIPTNQ